MLRVLILGVDGFLGNRLFLSRNSKREIYGTTRRKTSMHDENVTYFDSKNLGDLTRILERTKPDVVVNCIALTDVDFCETNTYETRLINTVYPEELAKVTFELGIKLVHISTDHYRSQSNKPRNEKEIMTAVNEYGKSKLEAEERIKQFNEYALIIRTNFFGFESNYENSKLLSVIRKRLLDNLDFSGYKDVFFAPVSVHELINALYKLIQVDASGVINIASDESLSKYDFAIMVAKKLNKSTKKICPVLSSDLKNLIYRPTYLSLDNSLYKYYTNSTVGSLDDMLEHELNLYIS